MEKKSSHVPKHQPTTVTNEENSSRELRRVKTGAKKKGMMTRMRTQEAEDHDHDHDHDEIEPIITYLSKDDL